MCRKTMRRIFVAGSARAWRWVVRSMCWRYVPWYALAPMLFEIVWSTSASGFDREWRLLRLPVSRSDRPMCRCSCWPMPTVRWPMAGSGRRCRWYKAIFASTLQRSRLPRRFRREKKRVAAAAPVFIVSDILADRSARVGTFGLESWLATPYWSAAKTGTSKDMRDNWCVGYSSRYTVAVWVGNAAGEAMHDVSGVSGAAPVWREVMDWLHRGAPTMPSVASRSCRGDAPVDSL